MKSRIEPNHNQSKLPCLMIALDKEKIVLMTKVYKKVYKNEDNEGTGVVVWVSPAQESILPVGTIKENWAMSFFSVYDGAVVLEN